jgi:hypothetical protein
MTQTNPAQTFRIVLSVLVMSFPIAMCLFGLTQKPQYRLEDAVTRGLSVIAIDYSLDPANRMVFQNESSAWVVNDGYVTEPPKVSFGPARVAGRSSYEYTYTQFSPDQWHAVEQWRTDACQQLQSRPPTTGATAVYSVAFRCGSYTNIKIVRYTLDELPVTIQRLIHRASADRF